jgi:hypothetical protein
MEHGKISISGILQLKMRVELTSFRNLAKIDSNKKMLRSPIHPGGLKHNAEK